MSLLHHNAGNALTYRGDTKALSIVTVVYWRYDKITSCGSESSPIYFLACPGDADPPEYLRVKNTNISPDCWRRYHRISSSTSNCAGAAAPSPAYWYDATKRTKYQQDYIQTESSSNLQMRITISGQYKAPCAYADIFSHECAFEQCQHTTLNIGAGATGDYALTVRGGALQLTTVSGDVPFCGAGEYGWPTLTVSVSCAGVVTFTNTTDCVLTCDKGVVVGTLGTVSDECEYSGAVNYVAAGCTMTFTVALI